MTASPGRRRIPLAIWALALALAGPTAAGETARVTGRVSADATGRGLAGARVSALERGLFERAVAVCAEDGTFALDVPVAVLEGRLEDEARVIDLRVVAEGHVGAVARDLELAPRSETRLDFRLVAIEDALRAVGLDPDLVADADGDRAPDALERALRLDRDRADEDEDGALDGLGAWTGGGPRSAPPPPDAAPHVLWPPAGTAVALPRAAAPPPVGVVFARVPGATAYRLSVVQDRDVALERVVAFAPGEAFRADPAELLLVGEGCVLAWTPPAGLAPGPVEVRLQGLAGDRPVGLEVRHALQLVEMREPADRVVTAADGDRVAAGGHEVRWSGLVAARSLRVEAGARIVVPAGEALVLAVSGDVLVERGATIRGEEGASVAVLAGGSVVLLGTAAAGAGTRGADASAGPASPAASVAEAGPGGPGGDALVVARGAVAVGPVGALRSGAGGRGGDAEAQAGPGLDALAIGGTGGPGGRLVVHAPALRAADRPERLVAGEGGAGGDARALGGSGGLDRQAGRASAVGGPGGAAGDAWLADWDLRADGVVALTDEGFPVAGGRAGAPGVPRVERGAPGTARPGFSLDGKPHAVRCTVVPGHGWRAGGEGQRALALGGEGLGSGDGGQATAEGGPGGPVARLGLGAHDLARVLAFVPTGGRGGAAVATGGPGGPGGERPPGDGGGAVARGGEGGAGPPGATALLVRGGDGGAATATGVDGLPGAGRCPARGQDGSAGGAAEARGGTGGSASLAGGHGGAASATGGAGGAGGQGDPGGRGGRGGDALGVGGEPGRGLVRDGARGQGGGASGSAGARGPRCPD